MVWKGDADNRLAKSLITLFDQVEESFPGRKRKGNDGTIGDVRHQASGSDSDHNPHIQVGDKGVVTALDITHDPANGFDAGAFAESLREIKDPRIKYVIFNGRIFSSITAPWVWRNRNKGPGDHSEHVHVSVLSDPAKFDDTTPWQFDKSQSVEADDVATPPPTIRLGDSGPAVVGLQKLLGITPSGVFDVATDEAVRAFQASRNLVVDGIVGSHTWGVLTETAPKVETTVAAAVRLPAAAIDDIVRLAGASDLARVQWKDRGLAPVGYIKGMAVVFASIYARLKNGESAAQVMAAAAGGEDDDALAHCSPLFSAAHMNNAAAGAATLRRLFVLMIGLGMRESSGRYYVGRDTSATNTSATSAEAGLFQMSWNMRSASSEMAKLFAAYSAGGDGFLSIFKEGAGQPKASDLQNFGTGEGVAYQALAKSCPAFAVETAAIGLRVRRTHWGPINRLEAEVRPEADALLLQVQQIVDALGAAVLVQTPETIVSNQNKMLALALAFLLKEKKMAATPVSPAQNVDPIKVLLPLLLQSAATGNQLDAAQIIAVLSGEKPPETTVPPVKDNLDPFGKLIDAIVKTVTPAQDTTGGLPVNNALGTTIGSLLDGKKTAIGTLGALATSLLSAATTVPPGAPAGTMTAVGQVLAPLVPAAGLSGFTMPVFLALAAWGLMGKMEKWTKEVADRQ